MSARITLTLSQDDNGSDAAMAETISLLTGLGVMPTQKIVITVECEEEDAASYEDDIDMALAGRPVGIAAVIEVKTKRSIDRSRKLANVTPMDKAW